MQAFRELMNVLCHICGIITASGRGGTAHAAQIHGNNRKLPG
jgi:ribosomal protein S27E